MHSSNIKIEISQLHIWLIRYLKSVFLWLTILCFWKTTTAQSKLDEYVARGISNNETIKQKGFAIQKSLLALAEAKTLFLPAISLQANYTLARGGRTVDFPAGDILNPVYNTLNQLTASNNFPQIRNQSILLNPDNFYDVRFRTTWPIINQEIQYNKRIKQQQVNLQQIEIAIYKRELVKDIKIAYYKYNQATDAIKIYQAAIELAQENSRINKVLFKNDKVNRTVVLRSENEVNKYQSLLEVSKQNQNSAKAYFNFLLNQPLNDSIVVDSIYRKPAGDFISDSTINKREELNQLNTAKAINNEVIGLSKSLLVPKLNTFVDIGNQGFDFKVNKKSPYVFFGLALQWDVFTGGKNKLKIRQAVMENNIIASQKDYAASQLQLQLNNHINAFNASISQYEFSLVQQKTSEQIYNDMLKIYKEGQALFIELLDAQNQWINARLQSDISLYDTWIKASEIERANASFTLNK